MSTSDRPAFWIVSGSSDALDAYFDATEPKRPPFDLLNTAEIHRAQEAVRRSDPSVPRIERLPLPADSPVPRLRIEAEGFAPALFAHAGCRFVSRRFREAAGPLPPSVQYHPVDATGSHADMLAADYRMLWVSANRDGIDPERSVFREAFPGRQGFPVLSAAVFREGFDPGAPLFHVPASRELYATEALADRMARAGLDDVVFVDPGPAEAGGGRAFRPAPAAAQ